MEAKGPQDKQQFHLSNIKNVIIDTDCGDDDIFAVLMLLYKHIKGEITVRGITTVLGILPPLEGAIVMKRLLLYLGLEDIPVHPGCSSPYVPNTGHSFTEAEWWTAWEKPIFDLPNKVGMPPLQESDVERLRTLEHATEFIARHLVSHQDLSLLCIGPLTNIAHIASKGLLATDKKIVLMGGNVSAAGNTPNKVSEWNFYADPQAVKVVLENCSGCSIYMCGLEIAEPNAVPRENQLKLVQASTQSKKTPSLKHIAELMQGLIHHSEYACTFDPVAAGVYMADFYTFEEMVLKVETEPPVEGKLRLLEPTESSTSPGVGKLYVGTKLNKEGFYSLLQEMIYKDE